MKRTLKTIIISILTTALCLTGLNTVAADSASIDTSQDECEEEAYEELTGIEGFVTRLYNICLEREPDTDGFTEWCGSLRSNRITGTECAYGFIFSNEFQNRNVTDEGYVELMYNCFFGRPSDAAGKESWLARMNEGCTREQLFTGFADSSEFEGLCYSYGIMRGTYDIDAGSFDRTANRASIEAFVTRLYSICLGRQPDPDGLHDWTDRIASGQITGGETAYGFFFSQEYINMEKDDIGYVTDLYNVILGRDPDPAGEEFWVRKCYRYSDMIVFNGFICSQEFGQLCASYGIEAGGKVWAPEALAMNNDFTDYCFSLVNMDTIGNNVPINEFDAADWYARSDNVLPYVWAGETMNGFDCSGLQVYIYRHYFHREIPHYAQSQEFLGRQIDASQIRPGDLLADHDYEGHGGALIYAGRSEDGRDLAITGGYGYYIVLRYVDLSQYMIRRID